MHEEITPALPKTFSFIKNEGNLDMGKDFE